MTDPSSIVREMLRDPALFQSLLVCAELSEGEDLSGVELDAARWQLGEAKLTFCPLCMYSVIAWPDGVKSDWPSRALHECSGVQTEITGTFQ